MAVFQIIYVVINVIAVIFGIFWFTDLWALDIVSNIFSFINKHFGKPGAVITAILAVGLFIPAISIFAVIAVFTVIIGAFLD